jgi:filamentous hemagglutinin family protein
MNKIYCLVWSAARGLWVVAHEQATARGKGGGVNRRGVVCGFVLGVAGCVPAAMAAPAPPAPNALPQGGVVAAGNAQIGNAVANTLQVNQGSQRAVINWSSFDIGSQAKVQFLQPNADASVLNRVLANDPTQIFGQLSANGQVYIVNPSGILFGKGSRVDAGALVATTLNSTDDDFMAGRRNFTRGTATGSVVNEGSLNAAPGGYVALLGASVSNSGSISTPGGGALLAAGDAVQLPLTSSGRITLEVAPATINAVVSNSGEGIISAPDGQVYISATTAGSAAAQAFNRGVIDVSSATGNGGSVTMQGHQVGLMGGSKILATGATGGGTVQIGGTVHDVGPSSASAVYVDSNASIDASATGRGNGGNVTLWSRDYTGYYGTIAARGGALGGDGGHVDTSSLNNLQAFGHVDASAVHGAAGNWLLDPTDVTIVAGAINSNDTDAGGVFTPTTNTAQIGVANINADLTAGTSVTINTASSGTGAGNITQNAGADILKVGGGNATLTMNAAGAITLNGNISSTLGALNTTLNAGGAVNSTGNLALNGGLLTINGTGNGTFSGVISGTGGLTQAGTGTTSLTGANTYTGATTVNAGILQVGNGGITGSIASGSAVSIGAAGTMKWNNNNAAATVTVANNISGSGTLLFQGQNSQVQFGRSMYALTGNNAGLTGTLAMNGARVTGAAATNFGSGTFDIQAGGQLYLPGGITLPNQVITEVNAGWWDNASTNFGAIRADGNNTFSGNIVLNDTTTIANGDSTGQHSTITMPTAGTTTFSGVISGPGGFKTGHYSSYNFGGALGYTNVVFSGTASNTYTGKTVIDGIGGFASLVLNKTGGAVAIAPGNVVQMGNATAGGSNLRTLANNQFGAGVVVNFANSGSNWGRFELLGTSQTLAGISTANGGGAIVENSGIDLLSNTVGTLTLNGTGSYSYNSLIRNTDSAGGGTLNMVYAGTGSQTFAGNSIVYTGTTTINSGQLILNQTGNYASPLTVNNGGKLSLTGVGNFGLPAAATIALNNGSTLENLNSAGYTAIGGAVTVSGNATITQNSSATATSGRGLLLDGGLKGSGTVTINALNAGSGVSFRNNNTTFSGSMIVNGIASDTPFAGSGIAVGGCTTCFQNIDLTLNGTMELNNQGIGWSNTASGTFTMGALSGNGVIVGNRSAAGATSVLVGGNGHSGLFSGSILDGANNVTSLVKNGAGTQILTGASTYSGTTTVNTGTLQVGNGGTTGSIGNGNITNNANLVFNRSNAITLANIINGSGNLTATSGNNLTLNGAVSQGGNILLTAGAGQGVSPTSVPNGSVTGGDVFLNASVAAGGAGKLTIYSGNATTAAYNARIAGSTNSLNKDYATAPGTGSADSSKVLNVFYRVSPTATVTPFASKVYDGLTDATIDPIGSTVTGIDGDVLIATATSATFSTPDVGTGKTVTFEGVGVASNTSGVTVNGYQPLPATMIGTGNITHALLTVQANNDAKFLSYGDTPGYAGVSYTGFRNGDTASSLGGSLSIVRTNAGTNAAGTYSGVLQASGLTSSNYTINYVNGDYTIVPANRLLIRMGNNVNAYGSQSQYGVQSAQYMQPNGTIVNLPASVTGTTVTVDGVGIDFYPQGVVYSNAFKFAAGGYQLALTGSTSGSSPNFSGNASDITMTGIETITPLAITLNASGVNKTYDGNTNVNSVTLAPVGVLDGDTVSISGTGSYANKNAGTNLSYTVSNLLMSGADSGNYVLNGGATTYNGNNGVITPAALTLRASPNTKVYDGTTSAAAQPTASGLIGADTVTGLTEAYANKHAGTGKTLSVAPGYTINDGNGGNNYTVTFVNDTTGVITPAQLTLTAVPSTKTYDGTNISFDAPSISGLKGSDTVSGLTQAYGDPNAGTGKALAVSGYTVNDGNGGNDYTVNLIGNSSGVINKAALTVQANNDSKFITQSDTPGYAGASYTGFVHGESAGVLGGSLTINRSNAGTEAAGNYSGVLQPSGLTSSNYAITYVNGDYSIVPASSLLVKLGNIINTYGAVPTYGVPIAQYELPSGTIVNLQSSINNGIVTVNDGVGGSVSFPVTILNSANSTGGYLKVGSYQLGGGAVTGNSGNFNNNLTVNGTQTVNPLDISLSVGGVSKVYDATTAMSNLLLGANGILGGDQVAVNGSGNYAAKNVGAGLAYTLSNLSLGGADGGNYVLNGGATSYSGSNGVITPAALTLTAVANSKTYDSTLSSAATPTITGLQAGDTIDGLTQTYSDPNVGSGKALTVQGSYTINDGNSGNNYTVTRVNGTAGVITPAPLTVSATDAAKTYDGTLVSAATPTVTGLKGSDFVTGLTQQYTDPNAGTGKSVVVQGGFAVNDGNGGNNYTVNVTSASNGVIYQAPLTIKANDDSKFVTQTDTPGYAGVSYFGFVNGENASVLGGALGITRTNAGYEQAGQYGAVLRPSGLTSSNYAINFVNGGYTIVASNELLVRLGSFNSTYGSTATYGVQSAQYVLPNGTVVPVSASVDSNGIVTVNDGSGGTVSFQIVTQSTFSDLSSSSNLKAGSYQLTYTGVSGNSSNFSNNLTVNGSQIVNPLGISLNVGGVSKVYNATDVMTNLTLGLNGTIGGDVVGVTGSGNYAGKNVGTTNYTVSGLALNGADRGNYVLNGGATTYSGSNGSITPAALTLTAVPGSKVYDSTTRSAGQPTVSGLQGGDTITGLTQAYLNANAGTGKTLAVQNGYIVNDDNGGNNYSVTLINNTTGVITPATLTLTAVSNTKTYDRTTSASGGPTVDGLQGSDTVTGLSESYTDANAGSGKTLQVNAGYAVNDGNGGANYTVNLVNDTTGVINKAALTITANANTKTYDATTSAAAGPTTSGLVAGDSVTGLSESYADKNAGSGKLLQVDAGYTVNDGNGGNNYDVSVVNNTNGVITPAALTLTAVPSSKTYDGNTSAPGAPTVSGLLGSDSIGGLSQSFVDKNVGTGKALNIGYVLNDGNGGGNYNVTLANTNSGTITPASLTLTASNNSKTYDSTTGASALPTISGLAFGDTVTGLSETYDNQHAGSGKTLSVAAGYTVNDGNGGNNYTVNLVSNTTGVITPAVLTVTATPSTKTYDGTLGSLGAPTVSGLFGSDSVSGLSQSYADRNAGSGKTLQVNGGYTINDGNGGNDYTVNLVNSTGGVINQAMLTLMATPVSKTYDASTSATGAPTASGLVAGDTVSGLTQAYADKNAGSGKVVIPTGYLVNDGNGGGNYSVNLVNSNGGVITPAALTLTAVPASKTYDATTNATGTPTVSGLLGSDTVSALRQSYTDKNAGSLKTLLPTGYTVNDGNGGGNYLVSLVSSNGVITPASIVLTAPDNVTKDFDGTTSVPSAYLPRIVSGDLGEGVLSAVLTYATSEPGIGKTVNLGNVVMNDGNGGRNYVITTQSNSTGVIRQVSRPFLMSEIERDKIEEPVDATVTVQGCSSGCVIQLSDIRAQLPDVSAITSVGGVGMADLPAGVSYDRAAGLLRIDGAGSLPEFVTVHALGFSGKPRNIRVRLSGQGVGLTAGLGAESASPAPGGARLP